MVSQTISRQRFNEDLAAVVKSLPALPNEGVYEVRTRARTHIRRLRRKVRLHDGYRHSRTGKGAARRRRNQDLVVKIESGSAKGLRSWCKELELKGFWNDNKSQLQARLREHFGLEVA